MTADQHPALRLIAWDHRAVAAISVLAPCIAAGFLLPFGKTLRAVAGDYGFGLVIASPVFAVLLLVAAHFIERGRHRRFVLGVAMLSLVYVPLGTLLGLFTLTVLRRPDVKAVFDSGASRPSGIGGLDRR
jgi:hypothetical protein